MRFATAGTPLLLPLCLLAVEYSDTYEKTFQAAGADARLEIENINGRIVVKADSGNSVRVTVSEYWKANSQADLDEARRDIRLEMQQTGNAVRVFLDGPFKERGRRHDYGNRHIEFRHDFEVRVPREIALALKTINGNEVRAEGTKGDFQLKNINGDVALVDAAGSGEVETLNGRVTARFVENPGKPTRFKSLNGMVDVAFQPSLSADLRLKSLNGDAYTDFDFAAVPPGGQRNNRVVRVGAGGIEHSFETLNGNIKITKYGK
jgi:DUF4097 and DUF4098 domain-containing protein YvlB